MFGGPSLADGNRDPDLCDLLLEVLQLNNPKGIPSTVHPNRTLNSKRRSEGIQLTFSSPSLFYIFLTNPGTSSTSPGGSALSAVSYAATASS